MNNKNQKGFTLIELLVVIAIIGLLSTMSVVALNQARQKSRDAKRLSDMKQIQTALELYFTDENEYPASVTFNGSSSISSSTRVYMATVPQAPLPRDNTASCTGSNYIYTLNSSGASYDIYYCLGETTGGVSAGPHHATPAGLTNP